jgi:hypothetical protein
MSNGALPQGWNLLSSEVRRLSVSAGAVSSSHTELRQVQCSAFE